MTNFPKTESQEPSQPTYNTGFYDHGLVGTGVLYAIKGEKTYKVQLKGNEPKGALWKNVVVEHGSLVSGELVKGAKGYICKPIPPALLGTVYKPNGRLTGVYSLKEC